MAEPTDPVIPVDWMYYQQAVGAAIHFAAYVMTGFGEDPRAMREYGPRVEALAGKVNESFDTLIGNRAGASAARMNYGDVKYAFIKALRVVADTLEEEG